MGVYEHLIQLVDSLTEEQRATMHTVHRDEYGTELPENAWEIAAVLIGDWAALDGRELTEAAVEDALNTYFVDDE